MAIYVLDTDILTDLEWAKSKVVRQFVVHQASNSIGVTTINIMQKLQGWTSAFNKSKTAFDKSRVSVKLGKAARMLASLRVYDFTERAVARAEVMDKMIRAMRLKLKQRPDERDIMIASTILENDDTILVTHNQKHFVHLLDQSRFTDWPN